MLTDIPKEASLEAYLVAKVKAMGGKCLKFVSPGTAGVPDRILQMPGGVTLYIELKRLGETPRPLQQKFIRDSLRLGHAAGWADTVEKVDSFLKEHFHGDD